ncbi:MAG TPA: aromatic amino acid transport family protein [Candidatus Magasanikbacteria bacterium]|nr:aromatic amino acid transport family protein [Candidatus Magasanikbacteria bacterium]
MYQNPDQKIVLHKGIYKYEATVGEAIFMITGMIIGAGVLGIPYVVAQSGLIPGLFYIAVLGTVMMLLNLMVGEIAIRTNQELQLPGFAGKYLGGWAKALMSFIIIFSGYGVLLAYIIGEGEVLSALFGGLPEFWSVLFWFFGSLVIWLGLGVLKKVQKYLSFIVISIIIGLSFFLFKKFNVETLSYVNPANIFLPFGVVLFALHATPAIVEAHALLPGSQKHFKKAIIIGSLIPMVVYTLFVLAVVGMNGQSVTEVATVGLSRQFGPFFAFLVNIFAAIAMGTCFMGFGTALKQTLIWDHKINKYLADIAVILVPIIIFALGARSFIGVLEIVGGLFVSVESILLILIYTAAKRKGDLPADRYGMKNYWIFIVPVFIVFSITAIYSVVKMF